MLYYPDLVTRSQSQVLYYPDFNTRSQSQVLYYPDFDTRSQSQVLYYPDFVTCSQSQVLYYPDFDTRSQSQVLYYPDFVTRSQSQVLYYRIIPPPPPQSPHLWVTRHVLYATYYGCRPTPGRSSTDRKCCHSVASPPLCQCQSSANSAEPALAPRWRTCQHF